MSNSVASRSSCNWLSRFFSASHPSPLCLAEALSSGAAQAFLCSLAKLCLTLVLASGLCRSFGSPPTMSLLVLPHTDVSDRDLRSDSSPRTGFFVFFFFFPPSRSGGIFALFLEAGALPPPFDLKFTWALPFGRPISRTLYSDPSPKLVP